MRLQNQPAQIPRGQRRRLVMLEVTDQPHDLRYLDDHPKSFKFQDGFLAKTPIGTSSC